MTAGSDSIRVEGEFSAARRDTLYHFEVAKAGRLEARIEPESKRLNIRFNQVLLPDGSADGPFSRQLSYSLRQTGWYALRIGPNRMAEGDTTGRFRLTLRIR